MPDLSVKSEEPTRVDLNKPLTLKHAEWLAERWATLTKTAIDGRTAELEARIAVLEQDHERLMALIEAVTTKYLAAHPAVIVGFDDERADGKGAGDA